MSRNYALSIIPTTISALALAMGICAQAATVQGLSVCTNGASDITKSLSCLPGRDTLKKVAGPDGIPSINHYGGFGGISDEHQTIFPPNVLNGNTGYMFFVASRSDGAADTGLVVLEAPPPDSNGQWTLSPVDGYGSQNLLTSYGQLFLAPVPHDACPQVPSASKQDPTFDLNYAAPGSVVSDPTNPGSLLMIYEGSNTCVGFDPGPGTNPKQGGVFITIGVATSVDYGKSWPVYRSDFETLMGLPGQNPLTGPEAPLGAFGEGVCMGDFCPTLPPSRQLRTLPGTEPDVRLRPFRHHEGGASTFVHYGGFGTCRLRRRCRPTAVHLRGARQRSWAEPLGCLVQHVSKTSVPGRPDVRSWHRAGSVRWRQGAAQFQKMEW